MMCFFPCLCHMDTPNDVLKLQQSCFSLATITQHFASGIPSIEAIALNDLACQVYDSENPQLATFLLELAETRAPGEWDVIPLNLAKAGKGNDSTLIACLNRRPAADARGVAYEALSRVSDPSIRSASLPHALTLDIQVASQLPDAIAHLGRCSDLRQFLLIRQPNLQTCIEMYESLHEIATHPRFPDLDLAEKVALHMIQCGLDISPVYHTLSLVLAAQRRIEDAMQAINMAIAASRRPATTYTPNFLHELPNHVSFMLMLSNYIDANGSAIDLHAKCISLLREAFNPPLYTPMPCTMRQIHIGILSPDLGRHVVSHFAHSLLTGLRGVTVFFTNTHDDKSMSNKVDVETSGNHWVDVGRVKSSLEDQRRLADIIESEHVDVLIDLTGHTAKSAIMALMMQPSRVIVNYLGYPSTYGADTVRYRITDAVADPHGMASERFTEALIRLPRCFLCYVPDARAPQVWPTPPFALNNGKITFGYFGNIAKLTDHMLIIWSRIIASVPGSRLVLKSPSLCSQVVQTTIIGTMSLHCHDIANRLEFLTHVHGDFAHLNAYNTVDIALDTYPYGGTTTSVECLYMGVPFVTRVGQVHASRVGASILAAVGRNEWVALTDDAYLQVCCDLARNPQHLKHLRCTLRNELLQSQLCDTKGFVSCFVDAIHAIMGTSHQGE